MDFQRFIPILEAHKGKMIFVHSIDSWGTKKVFPGFLEEFKPWFFLVIRDSSISTGNLPFLGVANAIFLVKSTEGNTIFENPFVENLVFPEITFDTEGEFDEINKIRTTCFGPGNEIQRF